LWGSQQQKDGFAGLRQPPGDPATSATSLVVARPTCIFAAVHRDFDPVFKDAGAPVPNRYITLIPRPSSESSNPSPWVISFDGSTPDGSKPTGQCV
jgi:hypothetical protein